MDTSQGVSMDIVKNGHVQSGHGHEPRSKHIHGWDGRPGHVRHREQKGTGIEIEPTTPRA